ncbi:DNA gyrase subunit A [Methylophaga sulfidovorans]|uniref:DNA gyrase subunit A n=1 Tax=Methylophaga sulfidovorans TaxID=45496 RepID=A0A1I3ZJ48_9GAMM|nr:DNA gyrase subunit A [Methylophaga sulfidovorans]SFK44073.1 DNA gyrase subunit A [Methylophaga sulfidovorans]
MSEIALELDSIGIETEMKQSYLDYAMSVIVGRALPDVRDGLKPVHRRVLYAMRELGNSWNSPYKKSARIVGDVIGKYHPHGDTAVYDTMVRMAQPFSMRYMLVDGQGNFGSVDGDPPAAMRYTEVRMAKIAHEMLADLEKETVDFVPNYDESESEPAVLPTKIPALLVNGSSGIAVGMATNIPPHNLTEILNACIAIIDNPDIGIHELMEYVPGPDFPTSGIINGARGIAEAYQTGRGRVHIRARADIETNEATGQQSIVVKELPYQVNKARLLEKIAELVKDKKMEGISALRDESDKDGMRMVIVLKRGEVPEVVLNNLYQQTQMQTVFGINMVAIVDGQPRTLNLKAILDAFIRHRREVVTRRSIYDLRKARERAHVLEGLATALANIDEVIELIKASPNPAEAKEALVSKGWASGMILEMLGAAGAEASRPEDLADQYGLVENLYYLSPVQAQAILDMRLHRLTGLEQDKILQEYREVLDVIAELLAILSDPDNLMAVIREELVAINAEYGDERRTEILANHLDLTLEDLITEEEMVVTLSHAGYAKTQQLDTYQAQKRGGKGKAATAMKDEDFIEHLFIANTHDTLLCFSSAGKVYWKKVYELPQGSRASRGKPIINLLPLEEGEKINAVMPIREFEADKFIFMATASGTVKKTPLVDYSRPRANGIIAVDLKEGDQLIDVAVTDGHSDVMLFSNTGKVIRFTETDVRSMGRVSRGVRGMRIGDDEKIISLIIAEEEGAILTATEYGYGKRTNLAEYRVQGRGGQGIISIQTSERNGCVVGAVQVCDENQIMLITNGGTLVRTPVKDVSLVGRNTQGVRLINLSNGEKLVGLERVIEDDDEDVDLAIDDADDTDETTEE